MEQRERLQFFCENLRRLRQEHNLSKANMAAILGVGVRTLNTLEQGIVSRRLGSSVLIRASDYFQISTDELFLPIGE